MMIGSGGRNRTYDKFRMKEVLYLLSYTTVILVSVTGFEPATYPFQGDPSTRLRIHTVNLVPPPGIEPGTSRLSVGCSSQLS